MSDESKGGAPKKLSTKDILAMARAQASGGAPAPAAEQPAPAATPATPAAAPKPAAGKKPTSTAEILAAARAQAAGGAAPAAAAPATPAAAPAAKPKPAAGGAPKSTAEILAAARAAAGAKAAGGAAAPAAPAATAKAPAAETASAPTGDAPKVSLEAMLAAVRPATAAATAAPAATGAAPAAAPAKPAVAPPMPAKPVPAAKAAAPAPDAGRRSLVMALLGTPIAMVGGLFSSAFSAAWTFLAATTGIATLATARFMLPNVLTEPPRKFKIGPPSDYDLGTVSTKWVAQYGIWIVHTDQYKGKNLIYALASVCTHLGCTPSWLEGERKYKCPCHGSGFYVTGINFEGPAPRPLERVGITLSADGMLEVDKSLKFQEEMGQWADPASFYEVVG